MDSSNAAEVVKIHYDAKATNYHQHYDATTLRDPSTPYPSAYFRLQLLLNALAAKDVKRLIEVGVGEGTPLATMAATGIDVWGFDLSPNMAVMAKRNMERNGLKPDQILVADIQDSISFAPALRGGQFDAMVAMGVMPHVSNDDLAVKNMASLIRPGGTALVEFRNKLFSAFTLNRNTKEFILDELLADVDPRLKAKVAADLDSRLRTDMPPVREHVEGTDAPGFDRILAKFHNPFEVPELFQHHGFVETKLHWYHYHPAMPFLADDNPELFREEAVKLEHEASGWRGYFLCSAFLLEARLEG